jgi:hypothetical protein
LSFKDTSSYYIILIFWGKSLRLSYVCPSSLICLLLLPLKARLTTTISVACAHLRLRVLLRKHEKLLLKYIIYAKVAEPGCCWVSNLVYFFLWNIHTLRMVPLFARAYQLYKNVKNYLHIGTSIYHGSTQLNKCSIASCYYYYHILGRLIYIGWGLSIVTYHIASHFKSHSPQRMDFLQNLILNIHVIV